jgi:hypothetical protein
VKLAQITVAHLIDDLSAEAALALTRGLLEPADPS